jgi:hypothetical protein
MVHWFTPPERHPICPTLGILTELATYKLTMKSSRIILGIAPKKNLMDRNTFELDSNVWPNKKESWSIDLSYELLVA